MLENLRLACKLVKRLRQYDENEVGRNELVVMLSLSLFLANAFPTTDITFPATQFTIPNQKQIAVRTARPVRMRAAYKCPTMAPNYVRL